ncbi:TlpA family protein disulfide reductase [Pseudonocardia benzenivorans]|jgi:thiol-disulfide isomerase/thioredoxin|uniref:Alkyl hydroperoxide reductase/ Thiol specific antioxidant/ Mal allergen n=2 Tax=Pseudonocardia TaxID=1847 RepID=F4CZR2_PSEUX|nr:TlpA disulfide reductase family protein [Pseudonocardia dioxanivorans]AEA27738.1 alkyl hydroperoxide reductase/ Thiol specific antioxidant/ Mal allergen [Pseudonocardia dioxanivorans CB1190]GJF05446.1 alkyl hydroperoxide reductase [Pseudonocardia sp. D17]
MRRLLPALAALAAVLLVAACATTGKDAVETGQEFQFVAPGGKTTILYDPPSSRAKLPALTGDSLLRPGTDVGTEDYAGKVLVVNIWGSWCGPCRAEASDLEFVLDQTQAQGVALLGIDVRDDRAAATDFVKDRGLTYESIFDPPGRVLAALSGYPRNTVPSTIVLDRQHRVAAVYLTTIRPSDLISQVQRVAEEPAP